MESEFLSEEEIGALYPGEWVLVKNAEFDEQWRVTRGLVAAHSPEREVIDAAQQHITEEAGNTARLCFKIWPQDVAILL